MATESPHKLLVRLLLSMFNVSELERIVRSMFEEDLAQHLPRNASPIETVDKLVTLLGHHGLLTREFFDGLIAERSRRADEIDRVAAIVLAAPANSSPHTPRPAAPSRDLDFIVFTALPLETEAVLGHLEGSADHPLSSGTIVELAALRGSQRRVGVVEIGAGNFNAAMIVGDAITGLRPRALLFVGVAGGIKDVSLGDVVASTKVYGYESGKETDEGFQPRPDVGESSFRLVQRARADGRRKHWHRHLGQATPTAPAVHVAPIAAGEKVVASRRSDLYKFLRHNYGDAVAVEMEGRGFLAAAHMHRVDAMVIRGISDMVDEHKQQRDREGWQPRAAAHAAAFAAELMANLAFE